MSNANASYQSMNLGSTGPIPRQLSTIEVKVSKPNLLHDYAKAFLAEAERVNPVLVEREQLTIEELTAYVDYLVYQRVLCVHDECKDFRKLKSLWIPSYLQYAISMIGEVVIRSEGLKFVPTCDDPQLKFEDMLKISDKIACFSTYLQVVQDAMPRDKSGDRDVMTTALIANYVWAVHPVEHVSATYVTAFLGLRVAERYASSFLYTQHYDDVDFIATALIRFGGLFK